MSSIKYLLTTRNISLILIILISIILFNYCGQKSDNYYQTAVISKGNIESIVNATGTIEPELKAEIIPHVTGLVQDVYVDYNSLVKKGDTLALIDPEQFKLNMKQAEADLLKSKSDLENNRNIYQSNIKLFDKGLISKLELDNSKVNYSSSLAQYEQANTVYQKSHTDYINTEIKTPIDGIVIDKNIIKGQLVSDSLDQKPVFTVINDLKDMNIIAPVNEVDIGKISVGNPVKFVTDAYPENEYSGSVKQIVSQPVTSNNIVTYNIIIQFENRNNQLKPGMTANLEILAQSKSNVLIAPKSAFRFTPKSYKDLLDKYGISYNDKVLWLVKKERNLVPVKVATGINDTTNIEITDGEINVNDKIAIGYKNNSDSENNTLGPIKIPGVKRF